MYRERNKIERERERETLDMVLMRLINSVMLLSKKLENH